MSIFTIELTVEDYEIDDVRFRIAESLGIGDDDIDIREGIQTKEEIREEVRDEDAADELYNSKFRSLDTGDDDAAQDTD